MPTATCSMTRIARQTRGTRASAARRRRLVGQREDDQRTGCGPPVIGEAAAARPQLRAADGVSARKVSLDAPNDCEARGSATWVMVMGSRRTSAWRTARRRVAQPTPATQTRCSRNSRAAGDRGRRRDRQALDAGRATLEAPSADQREREQTRCGGDAPGGARGRADFSGRKRRNGRNRPPARRRHAGEEGGRSRASGSAPDRSGGSRLPPS